MRTGTGNGVLLAILSAATFGTSGAFAASLLASGWSPGAAVTARVVLAAVALTGPAWWSLRGRVATLRSGGVTVLAYGVVAVAGAQLCYFQAVSHLSVAVALLLEYSGTLLVVGWLWARHGQRPRRLTMVGAGLALSGLALVLDLVGAHDLDPVGVLWGLGAAVGLAMFYVISAGTRDPLPPLVMAWAGLVVGGLGLLAAAGVGLLTIEAPLAQVTLAGVRTTWLVPVLELALIAAALAYVAGVSAARILGARLAAFIGLTEVVFAVLFAWVLLGQVPALTAVSGGALVLLGIALVRLDDRAPAASTPWAPAPSFPAPTGDAELPPCPQVASSS